MAARPLPILAAVAAALMPAPPAAAAMKLERVGTFTEPVYVTGPPGASGRLFVVERRGRVRIVRRGRTLRRPFLDLRREVLIRSPYETVDQRGLLSIAFAPDYAASGRFYVFFVDRRDRVRIDELRRSPGDPDRAEKQSRRTLLTVPDAGRLHHGGQLAFGPDGALYAGIGFGDREDDPQNPASLRGKIVRLDVTVADPAPEVWASGLRNPYRFSFDRTGRLIVADVGGDEAEEVTILEGGGANLGWPVYEGRHRQAPDPVPGYVAPALTHGHGAGWCSIVGGYLRRGRYVYGDVCSGRLYAARLDADPPATRRLRPRVRYLVSFGRDARGRLYAVGFRGAVWRLAGRP